jgi:hypothetical protein
MGEVLSKRGFDDERGNAHNAAGALGQDVVRFIKVWTDANLQYCPSTANFPVLHGTRASVLR